jgi:hypothetical protein
MGQEHLKPTTLIPENQTPIWAKRNVGKRSNKYERTPTWNFNALELAVSGLLSRDKPVEVDHLCATVLEGKEVESARRHMHRILWTLGIKMSENSSLVPVNVAAPLGRSVLAKQGHARPGRYVLAEVGKESETIERFRRQELEGKTSREEDAVEEVILMIETAGSIKGTELGQKYFPHKQGRRQAEYVSRLIKKAKETIESRGKTIKNTAFGAGASVYEVLWSDESLKPEIKPLDIKDKYTFSVILRAGRLTDLFADYGIVLNREEFKKMEAIFVKTRTLMNDMELPQPSINDIVSNLTRRLREFQADRREFASQIQDPELLWIFQRFFEGLNYSKIDSLLDGIPSHYQVVHG